MMNVKNIRNSKGNIVANQFVITGEEGVAFQSYNSLIATYKDGVLILEDDMWDYSATTRRHFKTFVNDYTSLEYENKAKFEKLIENSDRIKQA